MSRARVSSVHILALCLAAPACIQASEIAGSDGGTASPTPSASSPPSGTLPGTSTTPTTPGSDASIFTTPFSDAGTPTMTPVGLDAGAQQGGDAGATPKSGSGYQIELNETSVSGFSSGAFFAVQFHVAYSSILKGAAIFAGGPYACAQGNATTAETTCVSGSPDPSALIALTKQSFTAGAIDNPANLASERVFIFGGADDSVVHPTVVDSLDTYYAAFMGAGSIAYESRHAGASHTMPTVKYGGSCDSVAAPYVGNCGYDGAGKALQQIYGTLAAPATTLGGQMHSFAQSTFVASAATEGMAPTGYYYVPASCANGESCRIHVSFHGCQQDATSVNDAYYAHAGYNEWADTNHLIVLYPQAMSSSGNSYGCWDFWGYDGASYAGKAGTQMAAVRAMIAWLAAGGTSSSGSGSGPADASVPSPPPSSDAGTSACIKAPNTVQVAAGRATDIGGYAYAKGSSEPLGADNASTSSSLQQLTPGYYTLCL